MDDDNGSLDLFDESLDAPILPFKQIREWRYNYKQNLSDKKHGKQQHDDGYAKYQQQQQQRYQNNQRQQPMARSKSGGSFNQYNPNQGNRNQPPPPPNHIKQKSKKKSLHLKDDDEYVHVHAQNQSRNLHTQQQHYQHIKRDSMNRVPTKQLPVMKKKSVPPPVPAAIKNKYGTYRKQGGPLGGNTNINGNGNSQSNNGGYMNDEFKEVSYTTPGFDEPRGRQRSDAQNKGKFIGNINGNPNAMSNKFSKPKPPSSNRPNNQFKRRQWNNTHNMRGDIGMDSANMGPIRHKRTLSNKKNMGTAIQRRISQLQEKANANNKYYTGNKVEMADSPTDQMAGPNPLQSEQSNNY